MICFTTIAELDRWSSSSSSQSSELFPVVLEIFHNFSFSCISRAEWNLLSLNIRLEFSIFSSIKRNKPNLNKLNHFFLLSTSSVPDCVTARFFWTNEADNKEARGTLIYSNHSFSLFERASLRTLESLQINFYGGLMDDPTVVLLRSLMVLWSKNSNRTGMHFMNFKCLFNWSSFGLCMWRVRAISEGLKAAIGEDRVVAFLRL